MATTAHSGRRHYRKGDINNLVDFDLLFWLIPEALGEKWTDINILGPYLPPGPSEGPIFRH